MRLIIKKSVEISMDKLDLGDFIAQMELDSVEACKVLEAYRHENGNDALKDLPEVFAHLLEKLYPGPSLVDAEGSILKATKFHQVVPKMVVTMEGGLIQNIDSDDVVDVLVLDFDTDGVDETDTIEINGDECIGAGWEPNIDPELVNRCWDQYEAQPQLCILHHSGD